MCSHFHSYEQIAHRVVRKDTQPQQGGGNEPMVVERAPGEVEGNILHVVTAARDISLVCYSIGKNAGDITDDIDR